MTDPTTLTDTAAERQLEATRAEFRHILQPKGRLMDDPFPRSRTMRLLTSGAATPALAVVAVAFLATRPGVAGHLARATPVINLIRQLGSAVR